MTWPPPIPFPVPMTLRDPVVPGSAIPVEVAFTMRQTPRDERTIGEAAAYEQGKAEREAECRGLREALEDERDARQVDRVGHAKALDAAHTAALEAVERAYARGRADALAEAGMPRNGLPSLDWVRGYQAAREQAAGIVETLGAGFYVADWIRLLAPQPADARARVSDSAEAPTGLSGEKNGQCGGVE